MRDSHQDHCKYTFLNRACANNSSNANERNMILMLDPVENGGKDRYIVFIFENYAMKRFKTTYD
jgi:hypothetical protein